MYSVLYFPQHMCSFMQGILLAFLSLLYFGGLVFDVVVFVAVAFLLFLVGGGVHYYEQKADGLWRAVQIMRIIND